MAQKNGAYWILGAVLAFTLLEFPHFAFDLDHDLGSHASFEYYLHRGYQFGVQVHQNVGPLGCLHYTYSYAGYLHWLKIAGKCALRLALAAQILWFGTHLRPRWTRPVYLMSLLVVLPVGESGPEDFLDMNEAYAYLTLFLAGLYLMTPAPARAAVAGSLLLLAVAALTKHTSLVLASGAVCAAGLTRLCRRDVGGAAALPSAFAALTLAIWVSARQRPAHVLDYLRGAFAFSAGYNDSMAWREPPAWTILGAVSVATMLAAIALAHRRLRDIPRTLMAAAFLFVVWKHAFVRADAPHVTVLFAVAPFLTILFAWSGVPSGSRPKWPRGAAALAAVSLLTSFVAFHQIVPGARYRLDRLTRQWAHNGRWLTSPLLRTAEMERGLAASKRRNALPAVRARVGRRSADQFGFQPALLLLNDLNYTPRPMPITFAAANERLLRENEAFYRDPARAPAFVLVDYAAIERRLTTLDDGLALGALLDNYRPVLVEKNVALLERRPALRRDPSRRLVHQLSAVLGQRITVPDQPDTLVWAEVRMHLSARGRALALAYKPPLALALLEMSQPSGAIHTVRFVPSMGRSPFPLSPLVTGTEDILALYRAGEGERALPRLRAFALACRPGDEDLFEPIVEVRLYTSALPGP